MAYVQVDGGCVDQKYIVAITKKLYSDGTVTVFIETVNRTYVYAACPDETTAQIKYDKLVRKLNIVFI